MLRAALYLSIPLNLSLGLVNNLTALLIIMPMLLGLGLVSLFIWIAENLGTFTRTWLYPHQMVGWSAVSLGKLGSWFLLLIISYALVAAVNRPAAINDEGGKSP